jgi:hypothetical protein
VPSRSSRVLALHVPLGSKRAVMGRIIMSGRAWCRKELERPGSDRLRDEDRLVFVGDLVDAVPTRWGAEARSKLGAVCGGKRAQASDFPDARCAASTGSSLGTIEARRRFAPEHD